MINIDVKQIMMLTADDNERKQICSQWNCVEAATQVLVEGGQVGEMRLLCSLPFCAAHAQALRVARDAQTTIEMHPVDRAWRV
jgi:hypothetical protein